MRPQKYLLLIMLIGAIAVSGCIPTIASDPVFFPDPQDGPFYEDIEVTIKSSTKGADIFYTIDGSVPDYDSNKYQGPFWIGGERKVIVQAVAYADNLLPSNSITSIYKFEDNSVAPDLIISDLKVYYSGPEEVTTRFCVRNVGNGVADKFYVQERNQDNPNWDMGGMTFEDFEPGETYCSNGTRTGVGPNGGNGYVSGDNKIVVEVDVYDEVRELNEHNNEQAYIFTTDGTPGCVDSDGGKNFYEKGYISGALASGPIAEDICVGGMNGPDSTVRELFCNDDNMGEPMLYDCPNGCYDGACRQYNYEEPHIMITQPDEGEIIHYDEILLIAAEQVYLAYDQDIEGQMMPPPPAEIEYVEFSIFQCDWGTTYPTEPMMPEGYMEEVPSSTSGGGSYVPKVIEPVDPPGMPACWTNTLGRDYDAPYSTSWKIDLVGEVEIMAVAKATNGMYGRDSVVVHASKLEPEPIVTFDGISLNSEWGSRKILPDDLPAVLKDTYTDWNDQDLDYHEEIHLANGLRDSGLAGGFSRGALQLTTSRLEEDFDDEVYMTTEAADIKYRVVFEDFDYTKVGDWDEPLEFYFLGKWVKVIDFPDANSMVLELNTEYFLEEGDYVTIDGHTVKLVLVGENSAVVEVDGQRESISSGETESFESAEDFEVKVVTVFYIEGEPDNAAVLLLGHDIVQVVKDGDSVELFGEPANEDEADWLWDIAMTIDATPLGMFTETPYIGILNNIDRTDLDCDDSEERCALEYNEGLALPNHYAEIVMNRFDEEDFALFGLEILVTNEDIDLNDYQGNEISDGKGVVFSSYSESIPYNMAIKEYPFSSGGAYGSAVAVVENPETGEVEIWLHGSEGDDIKSNAKHFVISFENEDIVVRPPESITKDISVPGYPAADAFEMEFMENGDRLFFFVDADNDFFGAYDDEEASELIYVYKALPGLGDGIAEGIGANDYTYITNYGAIIKTPEDQFGSGNEFNLIIPSKQLKGSISVGKYLVGAPISVSPSRIVSHGNLGASEFTMSESGKMDITLKNLESQSIKFDGFNHLSGDCENLLGYSIGSEPNIAPGEVFTLDAQCSGTNFGERFDANFEVHYSGISSGESYTNVLEIDYSI